MSTVVRLFVSRNRENNNEECLISLLEYKGYTVEGMSLLSIQYRILPHLPHTDWLFFYSKNGLDALLSQFSVDALSGKKLAALGEGTAKRMRDFGLKCRFVGDGIPESTARAFTETAGKDTVTFIRASHSNNSILNLMPANSACFDLIAYDNQIVSPADLAQHDVAVITSSLNARAYYKFMGSEAGPVICIGRPTAKTAKELGLAVIGSSPSPVNRLFAEYIDQAIRQTDLNL